MMNIPTGFGDQEFEDKEQEQAEEGPVSSIQNLESLVIKRIGRISDNLKQSTKPDYVRNFDTQANNYRLTIENISNVISAEYKDKEKEEWVDVYLIQYNEKEKLEEDFLGLLLKQKETAKDQEEGNLRFLVKDEYLVLIHASKEQDKAAEKIFNGYRKRFGMNEVNVEYVLK